jgi:hypothetical protein
MPPFFTRERRERHQDSNYCPNFAKKEADEVGGEEGQRFRMANWKLDKNSNPSAEVRLPLEGWDSPNCHMRDRSPHNKRYNLCGRVISLMHAAKDACLHTCHC